MNLEHERHSFPSWLSQVKARHLTFTTLLSTYWNMGRQIRIPPQYATIGTVGFVAGWFSRGGQ